MARSSTTRCSVVERPDTEVDHENKTNSFRNRNSARMRGGRVFTSFVFGRIRCDQTSQCDRSREESGVAKPAYLVLRRRQRREWESHDVGFLWRTSRHVGEERNYEGRLKSR